MTELRAMTMPKWGIEMTEGTLSEWKVQAGERVKQGQILALIESDKIANEVEAEQDAVIARLVATEGDTFPVGELLAVFAHGSPSDSEVDAFIQGFRPAEGSVAATNRDLADASATAANRSTTTAGAAAAASDQSPCATARSAAAGGITAASPAQDSSTAAHAALSGITADINISPAARALAEQLGIDIATLKGSGRSGRISLQDVEQAAKARGTQAPDAHAIAARADAPRAAAQIERMSPMRKAIARQLTLSKSTVPHFYLRQAVRIDALLAVRQLAKQTSDDAPSLNAYFIRAAALALIEVPDVNVQVHGDDIHRFAHADISVAVATDTGLITPIVRAADTKSTLDIARETRELAERARAGKLCAEEFQGGSFTLSNLGMYGIDQFDAIINPPQAAILAIGAANAQPIIENGACVIGTIVNLALSCDHRAIDGAVGAKFMAALRALIESPAPLVG